MKRLILASQSPRRRRVLEETGVEFEIIVSNYEEDMSLDMPPNKLVQHLALGKANDVAEQNPDAVVIGADSIVVYGGQIIGKPTDLNDAKIKIQALQGNQHVFMTGFAVVCKKLDKVLTGFTEMKVWLRSLTDQHIDAYLSVGDPLGKAGGYSYEDNGVLLPERVEGTYDPNGLPISAISPLLEECGIDLLLESAK